MYIKPITKILIIYLNLHLNTKLHTLLQMDTNEKIFVIEDQTILDFYRENPNLDIVDVNRIFIDLLKK